MTVIKRQRELGWGTLDGGGHKWMALWPSHRYLSMECVVKGYRMLWPGALLSTEQPQIQLHLGTPCLKHGTRKKSCQDMEAEKGCPCPTALRNGDLAEILKSRKYKADLSTTVVRDPPTEAQLVARKSTAVVNPTRRVVLPKQMGPFAAISSTGKSNHSWSSTKAVPRGKPSIAKFTTSTQSDPSATGLAFASSASQRSSRLGAVTQPVTPVPPKVPAKRSRHDE